MGAVVLLSSSAARAQFIVPNSYTSTPGQGTAQGGGFNYFDDGGVQLTDNILGVNDFAANLGNGPAQEWVGWLTVDPAMSFNFSAPVNITQVQIGFNRNQGSGIFLPSTVTINGTPFSLAGTELADNTRGFLNFNTNFTGTSLGVSLADSSTGRWIFVDEVRFVGAAVTAAPEPGTFALTGIGLLLGGGAFAARRRRKA